MLVYTDNITPRLNYILDYIFGQRFGLNAFVETDLDKFNSQEGLKLNYSSKHIENVFQITPNGLLEQTSINDLKPDVNYSNNSIYLFANDAGHIAFDIFSACFWMISRYEEYQVFEADSHGRFLAKSSLAHKHEFLLRPLVDEWIMEFKAKLNAFYGAINFKQEEYSVIPTIDVDSPWCYKNKGIVRNLGGLLRDLSRVNTAEIPERLAVLGGLKDDAHFQFEWLNSQYKELGFEPIYFVLLGEYGVYDKTISLKNKKFVSFLKTLGRNNELGLHPSYKAADKKNVFEKELNELNTICEKTILKSRQHFLKITLPAYYQMLIKVGVEHDYSMGYADHAGFRAGTSRSYKFYDLEKEEASALNIHPFAVMDVSLAQYQNKTPDEALLVLDEIIERIKNTKGQFISLWHNESLSERMEWKGWREVYSKMLNIALQ